MKTNPKHLMFIILSFCLIVFIFAFVKFISQEGIVIPLCCGDGEIRPTEENPIAFPDIIPLIQKKKWRGNVGYYNTNTFDANKAIFSIFDCLFLKDNKPNLSVRKDMDQNKLPMIISFAQEIKPLSSKEYKIFIKEEGLPTGIYQCKVVVHHKDLKNIIESDLEKKEKNKIYETKDLSITILPEKNK